MRFDTAIVFHQKTDVYDPEKGEHVLTDNMSPAIANITDIGTNRAIELFGALDTGNKVIRLIAPHQGEWSYLTIAGDAKHYVQVTSRKVLKGNTLIVGEQHG
jgi:Zn-dependent alcohol dehydrogenase